MIKLTIDRHDIKGMIQRGTLLHGHAGPFLNLGIKMGCLALDQLNARGYFDLSAKVELDYHPPVSCLIDGLQISTGCTMGKGNICVMQNNDGIEGHFKKGNQSIRIILKPEILSRIDFEKETCENLAQQILEMDNSQLFSLETIQNKEVDSRVTIPIN